MGKCVEASLNVCELDAKKKTMRRQSSEKEEKRKCMQKKTKCGRKSRTNTQLISRTMCIDTIKAIKSKAIDKLGHKEKCDAHDYVIRTFDRFFILCMRIAMCVCVCVYVVR